jgi:hypothetical protein
MRPNLFSIGEKDLYPVESRSRILQDMSLAVARERFTQVLPLVYQETGTELDLIVAVVLPS